MPVPPHIPAPSCDISAHKYWQNIKIILTAVLFGLFSGFTGAAIMLGWVWPSLNIGVNLTSTSGSAFSAHENLSDNIRSESEDRLGMVYHDLTAINGNSLGYLSNDKKVGEAVFISSDGWMALYSPNFDGNYKTWRVFLKNGSVFSVQKVVRDVYSNLVFLKITAAQGGAQFKVANFNDQIKKQDDLFVHDGSNWSHTTFVDYLNQAFVSPHLDSAPSVVLKMSNNFSKGSWVLNSSGKFIGVTTNDTMVLPSHYISVILPMVLSNQKLTYRTLGVSGWFSGEQPIVVNDENLNGFVVAKVFSDTGLKVGDVITQINSQVVSADNLWYNIINSQSVKLQVLRKGKLIDVVETIKQI